MENFSASRLIFSRLKGGKAEELERNLSEKAGTWFVSFVKSHRNQAALMAREEGEKRLSAFTAFARGKSFLKLTGKNGWTGFWRKRKKDGG